MEPRGETLWGDGRQLDGVRARRSDPTDGRQRTGRRRRRRERRGRGWLSFERTLPSWFRRDDDSHRETARQPGSPATEPGSVDGDANPGRGRCGNSRAIASLGAGDSVLDLGSGTGFDRPLAAREVGETGGVIGVDTTPEMVGSKGASERRSKRRRERRVPPRRDRTAPGFERAYRRGLEPSGEPLARRAPGVRRGVSRSPSGRATRDLGRRAGRGGATRGPRRPELRGVPCRRASTTDRLERMLADAGFEPANVSPNEGSDGVVRDRDGDHDPSGLLVSARSPPGGPRPPTSSVDPNRSDHGPSRDRERVADLRSGSDFPTARGGRDRSVSENHRVSPRWHSRVHWQVFGHGRAPARQGCSRQRDPLLPSSRTRGPSGC